MKKIMIFIGSYLPGIKSAGVTTSISNMVDELSKMYEFYIVTADRDIGETSPYTSVRKEQWTKFGKANVYYSGEYIKSIRTLEKIINSIDVDLYYFNGFYNLRDTTRVLLLWKMKKIKQSPMIMAPRGIFSMGQFNNKKLFRAVYRKIFTILGFEKEMYWHATAELEKNDILSVFPRCMDRIFIAGNLSGIKLTPIDDGLDKQPGYLKIMFISRISEKKNIKFIVNVLKEIKGKVDCDLYGMIGTEADRLYWMECEEEIKKLPSGIKVNYRGELTHDYVGEEFRKHHMFFFPTFGENFGHVIAESIANGCPVLLSDTTPWSLLSDYKAGWVYSLEKKQEFVMCVQRLVDMNYEKWHEYQLASWNAAKELVNNEKFINQHILMFNSMLKGKRCDYT
ncbi:glycosyltransferase family 4 protein [Eisenbergiella sp.]